MNNQREKYKEKKKKFIMAASVFIAKLLLDGPVSLDTILLVGTSCLTLVGMFYLSKQIFKSICGHNDHCHEKND